MAGEAYLRALGAPEHPHMQGVMVPPRGLFIGNVAEPYDFDNDLCSGLFFTMYRPTYDSALDRSGNYTNGRYFSGKKRRWEIRVQFRFKVPPRQEDLYFGIVGESFVPMSTWTRRVLDATIGALRGVVGENLYHAIGDDPGRTSGETEKPAFVMPLWAFDQFVVTPAGEQPPALTDPELPNMGQKRRNRIRDYQMEMAELVFDTESTYTFCFWGLSQVLEKMMWQLHVPFSPVPLNFDIFCGGPPIHYQFYTLKREHQEQRRHLESRKNTYIDVAIWSTFHRPSWGRIHELLGGDPDSSPDVICDVGRSLSGLPSARNVKGRHWGSWLSCCVARA